MPLGRCRDTPHRCRSSEPACAHPERVPGRWHAGTAAANDGRENRNGSERRPGAARCGLWRPARPLCAAGPATLPAARAHPTPRAHRFPANIRTWTGSPGRFLSRPCKPPWARQDTAASSAGALRCARVRPFRFRGKAGESSWKHLLNADPVLEADLHKQPHRRSASLGGDDGVCQIPDMLHDGGTGARRIRAAQPSR